MAYQNVGTPRFYVNVYEWANSIGMNVMEDGSTFNPVLNTLPVIPKDFGPYMGGSPGTGNLIDLNNYVPEISSTNPYPCFAAILGHTFESNWGLNNAGSPVKEVINRSPGNGGYKGFSIIKTKNLATRAYSAEPPDTRYVGSAVLGVCYDMPHSPDLKLTMTREMDGVKRIRTKGGADLVNYKYKKPAMWGDAGAWELYQGSGDSSWHGLARSGRRVWNLSFSYLQDSDIFPDVSSLANYETISPGGTTWDNSMSITDNTLLNEDTFYSQVIHKTNGGQLPFIFQPDGSNNNPDGFAICKFDMKEFKFDQVTNGVYNIKLKIREVW